MATHPIVLHLIDTGGPGGAETVFTNVVTGLQGRGFGAVAAVPVKDWLWGALESRGVLPVFLPSKGAFDIGHLRGIARLVREHRATLIHTHLFTSAVYGTIAARLTGVPVVCTHHGDTDIATSGSYRQIKFRIVRRRSNHHVFVSHDLQRRFAQQRIISGGNTRVIHNGIDCDVFRPERDDALRSELGLLPDSLLVGAIGNLRTPKDYPTFVRAAADLAARSPRYHFVIAGAADEPIRSELLGLIGQLELSGRFTLLGFRSDVERIINALDVYVLSSSSEGFSLTTVQAMACGVPVVATRCGGPEEIVEDGVNGRLVAVRNPRALAQAIDALVGDDTQREAFKAAGLVRAREKFSITSMIDQYAALYNQCLDAAPAAQSA